MESAGGGRNELRHRREQRGDLLSEEAFRTVSASGAGRRCDLRIPAGDAADSYSFPNAQPDHQWAFGCRGGRGGSVREWFPDYGRLCPGAGKVGHGGSGAAGR